MTFLDIDNNLFFLIGGNLNHAFHALNFIDLNFDLIGYLTHIILLLDRLIGNHLNVLSNLLLINSINLYVKLNLLNIDGHNFILNGLVLNVIGNLLDLTKVAIIRGILHIIRILLHIISNKLHHILHLLDLVDVDLHQIDNLLDVKLDILNELGNILVIDSLHVLVYGNTINLFSPTIINFISVDLDKIGILLYVIGDHLVIISLNLNVISNTLDPIRVILGLVRDFLDLANHTYYLIDYKLDHIGLTLDLLIDHLNLNLFDEYDKHYGNIHICFINARRHYPDRNDHHNRYHFLWVIRVYVPRGGGRVFVYS